MHTILTHFVLGSLLFADSPVGVKAKQHEFPATCIVLLKKTQTQGEKEKNEQYIYDRCTDLRFRTLVDLGCEPETPVMLPSTDGKPERTFVFRSQKCHFVKVRYATKWSLAPVKENLCGEDRQVKIAPTEVEWQVCVPHTMGPAKSSPSRRSLPARPSGNLR